MKELIYYIEQLKHKDSNENAYHNLLELKGTGIVHLLIKAYHQENDIDIKAQLIEIAWNSHKNTETLEFLMQVVRNENPIIWKTALDGLVSIGGNETLRSLKTLKIECEADHIKSQWIVEAINQSKCK